MINNLLPYTKLLPTNCLAIEPLCSEEGAIFTHDLGPAHFPSLQLQAVNEGISECVGPEGFYPAHMSGC